jgi:spore coat polysaccharide biosynthesis protein SpsF (cytidylyltransferase family)
MTKNYNIGFIIPIRLSSERLPGKALRNLNGKTVFENLLGRIKLSKYYKKENVLVCTTTLPDDDKLENFLKTIGVKCFRGSVDDIIDRFYYACIEHKFDAVI